MADENEVPMMLRRQDPTYEWVAKVEGLQNIVDKLLPVVRHRARADEGGSERAVLRELGL